MALTKAKLAETLFEQLGLNKREAKDLVEGAPKGSYEVELVLAYYKNLSVFKRYYLPLQAKLPQTPMVREDSS